jgi:MFS family permease
LLVPGFVKGIAQGVQHPATYTLVLEAAPVEGRAAVMAFNGMIHRIGQTLGPLIFGVTYTFGGMDAVFDGAAALLVVTAIAVWFALGPGTSLTTVERSGRAH